MNFLWPKSEPLRNRIGAAMTNDFSFSYLLKRLVREAKQPKRATEHRKQRYPARLQVRKIRERSQLRERFFAHLTCLSQFGESTQRHGQGAERERKLGWIVDSASYLQVLLSHFPRFVHRSPGVVHISNPVQCSQEV